MCRTVLVESVLRQSHKGYIVRVFLVKVEVVMLVSDAYVELYLWDLF